MGAKLKNGLATLVADSLSEIGLPVDECRFYVAALGAGPSPVSRIASVLGISRPFAHKLAASLERRRLGRFAFRQKYARIFVASSPEILLGMLRRKRDRHQRINAELTASMPELLAFQSRRPATQHGVRLIDGTRDNIMRLRKEILNEAEDGDVTFYGSVADWTTFLAGIDALHKQKWIDERVRRRIRSRALVFEAPLDGDDAKELRELRVIRNVMPAPIAMQLYGQKAVVWLLKDALAVQITDPDIVRLLHNYFDMSWIQAKVHQR